MSSGSQPQVRVTIAIDRYGAAFLRCMSVSHRLSAVQNDHRIRSNRGWRRAQVAPSPRSSKLHPCPSLRRTSDTVAFRASAAVRAPTRGQGSTEKEPLGSDHTIAYHTAFTHRGFFASYLCLGRPSQHSSYTYHLCSARHPAAFLTAATIWANQTEKTRVLSHSDEATLRREHRVRACPHQLRQHLDRSGASSVLVSTTTTTTRCHISASARLPSIQQLLVANTYTYWYVPQAIHRTAPATHRDRRPVSLSRSEFPHPLFARPSELHIAGFYGAPRSSVSSPRRTVRSRCTQSVLAAASDSLYGLPSIPRLSPSSYPAFDRTLHAPPLPERPLPLVSLPNLHHDNVGPSPAGHVGPSRPTHIYFRSVGGQRTRIPQAERTAPPDASRHREHRCFTSVHSTYTSQQIDRAHPRLDNSIAPLKTSNSRPPSALSGARRSITHTRPPARPYISDLHLAMRQAAAAYPGRR